ncbi:MAG TPA: PDZ domain-containing protein [Ignavibacteria bacterium]|nr:PDZ domain-containing protein [Ignavibacteria bacterium]HMR40110.1 PDZ domain-containing protein [Ignavibacteria bacterium]
MSEINYKVSFEKPYTHYCEVEIIVKDPGNDPVIFSMPVWTPGSYLIREFAKNVEGVFAEDAAGSKIAFEKIRKNSWKVESKDQSYIRFGYKVYCNEFSVRTSCINEDHAFLSSSGIFMFIHEMQDKKCILEINRPAGWEKISTGLEKISENIYEAENYDILADSPIAIGNQEILEFEIKGIRHYICMSGKGNYDPEIIKKDFKLIAETEIKFFGGDIPYKHYTFIVFLLEDGGGGLEHLNSFVVMAKRWIFNDEKAYKKFLGLVSHEFFHVWNVKRIRPEALGPFDYENENYTKSLWVSEGFTNFYDNIFIRRSNILNNEEYFEFVDSEINLVMRFNGRFVQSLAESSFDAWIKLYRPNENSLNSGISYYTKGSLTAMILNIEIIKHTGAENSLDDVVKMLYDDYRKDNSKGFTDGRIREICETVIGKNLDDFWDKYINGTEELPLDYYLNYCGLELVNENASLKSSLDIDPFGKNGKLVVRKVFAGGSAYESGINANDEIIAIEGIRVDMDSFKTILENYSEGMEIELLISRDGFLKNVKVKLIKPLPKYKIREMKTKNDEQVKFLDKWIGG